MQGELSSLLVEEDYNLSTMVSKFSKNKNLLSYPTLQLISWVKLSIFSWSNFMHLFPSVIGLGFKIRVFYASLLSNVENSIKCPLLPRSVFLSLFKVTISIHFQWSSSHGERTKIIQEGLLNPLADILETMTKTEAIRTGRIFLFIFRSSIP